MKFSSIFEKNFSVGGPQPPEPPTKLDPWLGGGLKLPPPPTKILATPLQDSMSNSMFSNKRKWKYAGGVYRKRI